MVVYHYNATVIFIEPITNRQLATLTVAWKIIKNRLKAAEVAPKSYIMDNECSDDLKATLSKKKLEFQLVPTRIHRANKVERVINTFKGHLKAGLDTLNSDFPIHNWDRILTPCELTLNILQVTRINLKLLA